MPNFSYNTAMKRLYWTEPTLFELDVNVTALNDREISIDPILFHPEEGGQPADRGTVGDAAVLEVNIVDGRVVLSLDRSLDSGTHRACVDRAHRVHTASQHSAQHILSGVAEACFNLETTGVHIGLERSTVDFQTKIDWPRAQELERRAMDVVLENLEIETVFDEASARSRFDLTAIDSDVLRVVKIGPYDASACCGAHVQRTGDIGIIRIVDLETKKQGTRLSIVAGARALAFSQGETSVLRSLRTLSNCSTEELPAMVEKTLARSTRLVKEIDGLHEAMLPALVDAAVVFQDEDGSTNIGIQVTSLPGKLTGKLAALIAEHVSGSGVVLNGQAICIHSKADRAKALLQKLHNAVGGKGGGSPQAASGMLAEVMTAEQIEAALRAV